MSYRKKLHLQFLPVAQVLNFVVQYISGNNDNNKNGILTGSHSHICGFQRGTEACAYQKRLQAKSLKASLIQHLQS